MGNPIIEKDSLPNPLGDAVLEFKLTFLASLVFPITYLISSINQETGEFRINWMIVLAMVVVQSLTAFLKALDKYKHEMEKRKQLMFYGEFDGKSHGLVKA